MRKNLTIVVFTVSLSPLLFLKGSNNDKVLRSYSAIDETLSAIPEKTEDQLKLLDQLFKPEDPARILQLITQFRGDVNKIEGATLLHRILSLSHCQSKDLPEYVKALLTREVDVTVQDSNGFNSLHRLIEANVELTSWNCSPLQLVLDSRKFESNRSELEAYTKEGETVLHIAARGKVPENVRLLLKHLTPHTPHQKTGLFPLHLAAQTGHLHDGKAEILSMLLEDTLEPNITDDTGSPPLGSAQGLTALHCAAGLGNLAVLEALFACKSVNPAVIDKNGMTPHHYAAQWGKTEALEMLIKKESNAALAVDRLGRTPLHLASKCGSTDCMALLLNSVCYADKYRLLLDSDESEPPRIRIDIEDLQGDTPLFYAVQGNKKNAIAFLLERTAKKTPKNKENITPFYLACKLGFTDSLQALIVGGARCDDCSCNRPMQNHQCQAWDTPFFAAIRAGRKEIVGGTLFNDQKKKILEDQKLAVSLGKKSENGSALEALEKTFIAALIRDSSETERSILKKVAVVEALICAMGKKFWESKVDGFGWHHRAVQSNSYETLNVLLNQDIQLIEQYGGSLFRTPLHFAAEAGADKCIELLLRELAKKKLTLDLSDSEGRTALHLAVINGKVASAKLLLEKPLDVDLRDMNGRTALDYAVTAKDNFLELVEILLEKNAKKELLDNQGENALIKAFRLCRMSCVKKMVDRKKLSHNDKCLLFFLWIFFDNDEEIDFFSAPDGRFIDLFTEGGFRALFDKAVEEPEGLRLFPHDKELFGSKCLLLKMSKRERDYLRFHRADKASSYHLSALLGKAKSSVMLLQQPRTKFLDDIIMHQTPLHMAAEHGHLAVVKALARKMKDEESENGWFSLHWAVHNGHAAVTRELLNAGFNVNEQERNALRRTALHLVCRGESPENKECLKVLRLFYADPNLADSQGKTPLDYARESNLGEYELSLREAAFFAAAIDDDVDSLKAVVAKGVSINLRDEHKKTALHVAAQLGSHKVVKYLLDNQIEQDAIDGKGFSALHFAALNVDTVCMEMLLLKGADVNIQSESGKTPLHCLMAAVLPANCYARTFTNEQILKNKVVFAYKRVECFKKLLARGVLVNKVTTSNETPLHYAVIENLVDCIELLLREGADKSIKDSKSRTPYDIAKGVKAQEVLELLSRPENIISGIKVNDDVD